MRDRGQQRTLKDEGRKKLAFSLIDVGRGAIMNNKDSMRTETKEVKSNKGKGKSMSLLGQRIGEISTRKLLCLRPRETEQRQ